MEQLRIGLAGAGLIGGTHSIVLHQIAAAWPDRVQLTAVADPLAPARERFAEQFGYRQTFADARDLLAHGGINVLFVCTPTKYHAELVRDAALAGVHLFCEKPLAMSAAEAGEMLVAVRRSGVYAQIGLVLRYSPVYAVMRDMLADAALGEAMAVWFRDDQCFPIRGMHDTPWRMDRALTAGGTLIEHGVHDLDLLTWMFGPVARLRAWEQNRAGHPGIEDYMAVELEFATGLRGQLLNLWHDMAGRPSNRRLEIFCRNAFIASEHDMLGTIEIQRGDGAQQTMGTPGVLERYQSLTGGIDPRFHNWAGVPYFLQDLAFVESLLAGRAPTPGLELGVAAQVLAEAVYTAARSDGEIAL